MVCGGGVVIGEKGGRVCVRRGGGWRRRGFMTACVRVFSVTVIDL